MIPPLPMIQNNILPPTMGTGGVSRGYHPRFIVLSEVEGQMLFALTNISLSYNSRIRFRLLGNRSPERLERELQRVSVGRNLTACLRVSGGFCQSNFPLSLPFHVALIICKNGGMSRLELIWGLYPRLAKFGYHINMKPVTQDELINEISASHSDRPAQTRFRIV